MNSRPTEVAEFDERARAITGALLESCRSMAARLPDAPLDAPLNEANAVRYLLCLYVIGAIRSANEVCKSFQLVWFSGQFLVASMLTRMLIELWGSIAFAEQRVLQVIEAGDPLKANAKMVQLIFGSKGGVRLHNLLPINEPAINVMEFVRAADALQSGAQKDYEFLCDAAHPSYLANTFLVFAGSEHNSWSNEVFAKEMHEKLDRTLTIADRALKGIVASAMDVFERTLPQIEDDYRAAAKPPECGRSGP